jgi:hypothetical protein
VLLVVDKLKPAVVPHERATHEAVSPVVTVSHAILVLQQKGHIDLALEKCSGDGVPVAHHQSQNFVGFVQTAELANIRHLAAENLPVVLTWHHHIRSGDEGGEEPVEFLDVHRPAALASSEEFPEAVEFGIGQRFVLGEGLHWECPSIVNNRLQYHPRLARGFRTSTAQVPSMV